MWKALSEPFQILNDLTHLMSNFLFECINW